MSGYITLSKELFKHDIFMRPERLRFFLWLLSKAEADGLIEISPKAARIEAGVSPKQYRLWLDYLCANGFISKAQPQHCTGRKGLAFEANMAYCHIIERKGRQGGKRRPAATHVDNVGRPADMILTRQAADTADTLDFDMFMDFFNRQIQGTAIQPIRIMTPNRKTMVRARLGEYGKNTLAKAVSLAVQSDFLSGRSGRWSASFDWIFKAANFIKIIEGTYNGQGLDNTNNKSACKAEVGTNGIGKVASAILQRVASDKA